MMSLEGKGQGDHEIQVSDSCLNWRLCLCKRVFSSTCFSFLMLDKILFSSFVQVATGNLLATLSRHFQSVSVLKFSDDGSHFLSGGEDNLVMMWKMAR